MRTLIITCFLAISFSCFSQGLDTYYYLTIEQDAGVFIAVCTSDNYDRVDLPKGKAERPAYHDWRPFLTKIEHYESEGWELVSDDVVFYAARLSRHALMRRNK